MKTVFMGTPVFAVNVLEKLLEKHEVICVITQPDKPKGRKNELAPPPVKVFAQKNGIPVLQPERVRGRSFIAEFKDTVMPADVFAVAAYGQIIPQVLLDMPKYGCINVHASILPKYRGAAPIQRAIINGEKTTGVTVIKMDKGIDTGDIILRKETGIADSDTGGDLFERLSRLGGGALCEALEQIEAGTAQYLKQDGALATYAPMITNETCRIDFSKSPAQISDLIRGVSPDAAAYTFYNGKKLAVWKAEASPGGAANSGAAKPGEIVKTDKNGIAVMTGAGCVLIKEVQPESAKRMDAASFARGRAVKPGDIFFDNAYYK